jgi:hypothetical protein
LRGPFGSTLARMARPYIIIGPMFTSRVDDTTWHRVEGVGVPWAPEVSVPMALDETHEYRMVFDKVKESWTLYARAGGR